MARRVRHARRVPRRAGYRALLTEAYDLDKPTAPEAELAFWRAAAASGPASRFAPQGRSG
ncbi:MAG: hypothetical protein ABS81_25750 [Pseudonocardia sp. SCN 72-86]|nr:MAG: hypothetical protein ABS81_25750 [Pseudonocardia sp. SCN 72-86]